MYVDKICVVLIMIDNKIAVIGLGYVGLPLAVEFGKKLKTVGFDIDQNRVRDLQQGVDSTLEVTSEDLSQASNLTCTAEVEDIADSNIYIITVPTPIDQHKQPDLRPLISASKMIGRFLKDGDLVIYESTVYPGATEEICVPLLEQESGLTYIHSGNNEVYSSGFYCGYSPERINPGDKVHRLTTIKKVVSGSTVEIAQKVDSLYREIIEAGTFVASSIRVAEAAKVIENTQRDVNIALINELALVFGKLGIDTEEVLNAAGTKWNFLPFRPGLVGGHCIGVDPYYLTHKAAEVGYHPEIILAGRRINDNMGSYVADQVAKLMMKKSIHVVGANILVMGLTFKENCPDLRNTRVIDLVNEFKGFNSNVDVYDPWVDSSESKHEYGVVPVESLKEGYYDAIVIAVAHKEFIDMSVEKIRGYGKQKHVLYDIKYILSVDDVDGRL